MTNLPDNILEKLQNIADQEGFRDFSLDAKPGSNHGDNFLGELYAVTINGKRNINGKILEDKLHLLCKTAPSNQHRREHFNSAEVFKREIYVYNKLLPFFAEFQKKKCLEEEGSFTSYPKCYVAVVDEENDDYLVIMEDLREKGYEMWPKNKPVNLYHSRLVAQELAKFHAISFALKDQQPKVFEEFAQLEDISKGIFLRDTAIDFFNESFEKIQEFLSNEYQKGIIEDFKNNLKEHFERCLDKSRFAVITHGDCWNNNILYHYKNGTKVPDKVCLVDYQLVRYSSPVLDLHYNLFISTDRALREQDYNNILDLYYTTLSKTIKKLGSNPQKIFSYDDFQQELKRFGNFGMLLSCIMVRMCLTDPKDILNLDEYSDLVAKGGPRGSVIKASNSDSESKFKERLVDLLEDFVKYDYYTKGDFNNK